MKTTAKKGVGAIVGAWLLVKAQEFIAYTDTVDTIDWSAVGSTAISELMTGAVALIALFTRLESAPTTERPVIRQRLDPDFDSFDAPARPSAAPIAKARSFTQRSLDNLNTCHPDLIKVAYRALEISKWDFAVISGNRSEAQQRVLVDTGKSETMNSGHVRVPSIALDVYVYGPSGGTWQAEPFYSDVRDAFAKAAAELGVPMRKLIQLRAGLDYGHHELLPSAYPDVTLPA